MVGMAPFPFCRCQNQDGRIREGESNQVLPQREITVGCHGRHKENKELTQICFNLGNIETVLGCHRSLLEGGDFHLEFRGLYERDRGWWGESEETDGSALQNMWSEVATEVRVWKRSMGV